MPAFGDRSRSNLDTCHPNLILLFDEVIKGIDCSVIYGHRTVEVQQGLWAQGRTKPGRIVTYCDGLEKRSRHQGEDGNPPSFAVDVVPYPIDWDDIERHIYLAGWVMATARKMGVALQWGGHWESFRDYPHYELIL